MQDKIDISVVIPVYNEEGNILGLYQQLITVLQSGGFSFEIIFVDDGSKDGTLDILKKITTVKIIIFRKNFGQTAALDAGIKMALGKYIITMDGDGQNDPIDIPRLLEKLERENLDVVSGWRRNRHDSWTKKISSHLMAKMRRIFINDGVHDSGCTLKIYRRECFNNVDLVGEMHRFIPALLKIKGFKIGELEVTHHHRRSGHSKYNWKRGVKGNLDMFSVWFWKKYANRPLHLFGGIGLIFLFVSIFSGLWAIYGKFFREVDLSDTALTMLSIFGFMIGLQFFVFGLLADMISKTYFSSTRDKVYDIKEIIEDSDEKNTNA